MQTFLSILRSAVEAGASDIHLKPDSPIVFRVSRDLVPVDGHVPKQDWLNSILQQIVPKHLQTRLAEDRETDFAYSSPGLGRFRVNVFQQRGVYVVSMRLVKEPPEPLPFFWRGAAPPGAALSLPTRGPVMANTTPPNITTKPTTDRIGKPPIIVALNATPDTSIARPSTNSAAPCNRRRVDGARRLPPRTLDANFGSSA